MKILKQGTPFHIGLLILSSMLMASGAQAGAYLGGSVGSATIDIENFDENDSAWKVFGGYQFDLPVIELAIEGGYVDLGSPSSSLGSIDTTAIDVFAVVGFDFSFINVFGKVGFASWDANINEGGGMRSSDDGSDSAYGVGVEFDIASLGLRVEYEKFDIEHTDDVNMVSVGLAWYF